MAEGGFELLATQSVNVALILDGVILEFVQVGSEFDNVIFPILELIFQHISIIVVLVFFSGSTSVVSSFGSSCVATIGRCCCRRSCSINV